MHEQVSTYRFLFIWSANASCTCTYTNYYMTMLVGPTAPSIHCLRGYVPVICISVTSSFVRVPQM